MIDPSYSISFPVAAAQRIAGNAYLIQGAIRGTCFSIGGDFVLTAGHAVEDLLASPTHGAVVAFYGPPGRFVGAEVAEAEVFDCDAAILRLDHVVPATREWFQVFRWTPAVLPLLTTVRSVGYAYGVQLAQGRHTIVHRAFQGTVVSSLSAYERPSGGDPITAYELSFAAPRGQSGAPLFVGDSPSLVAGMILGNSESKMLVFESEERQEDGSVSRIEKYESLTLGLAAQSSHILAQRSEMLGTTIKEYLGAHGLLEA